LIIDICLSQFVDTIGNILGLQFLLIIQPVNILDNNISVIFGSVKVKL